MKRLLITLGLTLAGVVAHADELPANVNLRPGPVASKELFDALIEKDRQLFDAIFTACDADALAPLVADDFEFFHDKDGKSADSGAQFIASIRAMCERRRAGTDFISRRDLDAGSVTVHPLAKFGAMQMGTHRFYAIVPGQPDRLVEEAKFIDLWQQDGDTWKLARVISYDHRIVAQD
jgi:hypothetical protein